MFCLVLNTISFPMKTAYKVKLRLGEYALQDPPLRSSTDASVSFKVLASRDEYIISPKNQNRTFE